MKERPILFSAPMVRAILEGRKTQTRRVIKLPRSMASRRLDEYLFNCSGKAWPAWNNPDLKCPYGKPGDRLWVRETWAEVPRYLPMTDEDAPWREDGRILVWAADPDWKGARQFLCADGVIRWAKPARWRPSIHMPRFASRITLEVTGVRVERLQATSEADATAEGVQQCEGGAMDYLSNDYAQGYSPVASFRSLWESIYGADSWAANPWVWVVEFKRMEIAP